MNVASSTIARRREPSGFITLAAGITAVCSVLACSPVVGQLDAPATESTSTGLTGAFDLAGNEEDCAGDEANPGSCGCGDECLLTQVCDEDVCGDQLTDCSAAGVCEDPTCTEPHRYSVDEEIAADLSHGRRLWQRDDASDLDYAQAAAHCASLDLGGLTGGRLPDGGESGAIVYRACGPQGCGAPGSCTPAIDQAVIPRPHADLY